MTSYREEIRTQDRAANAYEEIRYRLPWSRRYHAWLLSHMISLLEPQGEVLDAGCGVGVLAEYLPHVGLSGIDISREMLRLAKARMDRVVQGDVENLPYPDNAFDCVFARSVIHHLPHPNRGVRELIRVLKPGGRIIFLDTRDQNPFSRVFRERLTRGEHFSDLHQNMRESSYLGAIRRYAKIEKTEYMGYLAYTLMGFPDVFNLYRFVPLKFLITPVLMAVEKIWARIPLFNRFGLGLITLARK